MELTSGRMLMEIDPRNGAITRLVDTCTGLVHLDVSRGEPGDGRLFRFLVPTAAWSSRYVDSRDQAAPDCRADGTAVRLRWDTVTAADGTVLDISVEARLEVVHDEIRFTLALTNRSDAEIVDVHFPCIGGWTGIGGQGCDVMNAPGIWAPFDPHSFPLNKGTTYVKIHQRAAHSYPVELYLPWVDLSGPGGGISYSVYMTQPQNGFLVLENLAGYAPGLRLSYGWLFPTVVASGEEWVTPPIGIALHAGDWHDTADRYQAWMETWFTPPPGKPASREAIGFQNVFLRSFDGKPVHALDSIPVLAEAGRRYGVDQLSIWDYLTLGAYARHLDCDLLDYSAEEKAVLHAGLTQAKSEGTNVSALINFRLLNPVHTLFSREAHAEILRNYDGSPRMESYPATSEGPHFWANHLGPSCYPASPFAPSFRARVLRQTREYLALGYCSMFFDQPFETSPDYGHRQDGCRPEDTYAAVRSLVAEVRDILHADDPDALIIGEFCEGFMAQHIDQWMSWYVDVALLVRARYALPQPMQSWVVDNNPAQASHAFALGTYLCLCTHGGESTLADVPAFGAHVAALARLRRRTAARTVHARFRDTRGLTVAGSEGFVAYAYDSPDGPAVIAAATRDACSGSVTLQRDAFTAPGNPREGLVYHLDGRTTPSVGDTHSFTLAAHDVAVWVL